VLDEKKKRGRDAHGLLLFLEGGGYNCTPEYWDQSLGSGTRDRDAISNIARRRVGRRGESREKERDSGRPETFVIAS
jgi:hypothetical protein